MKIEQSTAGRSLRLVGMAITLVSITVFATVVYSAYADVSGVLAALGGRGAISARVVTSGVSATLFINVTVANGGLYPVSLSITCSPPANSAITCAPASVTVPARQTGVLRFSVTAENVMSAAFTGLRLPANATVSLQPFASISSSFDLGSLLRQGGA